MKHKPLLLIIAVMTVGYSLYSFTSLITSPHGSSGINLANYYKVPDKGWFIPVAHKAGQKFDCPKGTGTRPDERIGGCTAVYGAAAGSGPRPPKPIGYRHVTVRFVADKPCYAKHARPTGRWWEAVRYSATELVPKKSKFKLSEVRLADLHLGRHFHVDQCLAHYKVPIYRQ
jgi:hypothetical protein